MGEGVEEKADEGIVVLRPDAVDEDDAREAEPVDEPVKELVGEEPEEDPVELAEGMETDSDLPA